MSESANSSKGLLLGLVGGALLLVTCCCTGIGGAGIWFYVVPKVGEGKIVGVWREGAVTFEFRADGKLKRNNFDLVYKFVNANTIEIGPDAKGNNTLNGQPYPTIRYRVDFEPETLILNETSTPAPGQPPEKYVLKRR